MKNYLRTFPTYSDYLNADGAKPDLAYIKDEGRTIINGSHIFYNVDGAKAGDILLEYSGTRKCFCSLGDWKMEMLYSGYKPIGVVAIPSWMTPDNTVRVMSLVNMSTANPTSGSATVGDSNTAMMWGYDNEMSEVTYYDTTYPKISVSEDDKVHTSSIEYTSNMYVPSDTLNPNVSKSMNTTYINNGAYYFDPWLVEDDPEPCYWSYFGPVKFNSLYEYYTTYYGRYLCADPYVMFEYFSSSNPASITANLDGKGETGKIMACSTTTTISNVATEGHYPAAECCNSFKTTTTAKGDWYLPTVGELIIMFARAGLINNTLKMLQETPGVSAIPLGSLDTYQECNPTDTSSYGSTLASSTQGSFRYYYYNLNTTNGKIYYLNKTTNYTNSTRVRAFLAIS